MTIEDKLQLLDIQEVTTSRQKKNGTRVFRNMFGNNFILVNNDPEGADKTYCFFMAFIIFLPLLVSGINCLLYGHNAHWTFVSYKFSHAYSWNRFFGDSFSISNFVYKTYFIVLGHV